MTKDKDIKTVVPILRFPEFRDAEGWNKETIGNLYVFKSTNSFSRDALSYTDGFIKNIHYGDIHTKFSTLFDITKEDVPYINSNIDIDKFKSDCFCQASDVVFADASEDLDGIGKCIEIINLNNEHVLSGLHTILARQQGRNFVTGFAGYLFKSDGIKTQIHKESQGAKVLGISSKRLSNIILVFPKDKIEQTKITSCLRSLDDLINAVVDKIEVLNEHKKGLMEQLFPAEGKTTPSHRFPEFQNTGEWKNKMLSDVCKLVRGPFGGTLKKEIFVEDGYAVYEQSHAIHGNMNVFRYYITEYKFNELIRFAVCPNDIIMSCSGTMGKFSIIPANQKKGVINQALLKISTKKDNDYRFIKFLLELPSNQEKLLSESAGGAIKNVASVGQIKGMPLYVPEQKEQQKIADCLSSIDDLISAETDKFNQLKAHKKGLMQQLFPTLND